MQIDHLYSLYIIYLYDCSIYAARWSLSHYDQLFNSIVKLRLIPNDNLLKLYNTLHNAAILIPNKTISMEKLLKNNEYSPTLVFHRQSYGYLPLHPDSTVTAQE